MYFCGQVPTYILKGYTSTYQGIISITYNPIQLVGPNPKKALIYNYYPLYYAKDKAHLNINHVCLEDRLCRFFLQ